MPKLTLRIHPDPAPLLREAADAEHGFRMEGVLLAVRQGGIRDDIYREAGAAGFPGWFDPPVVIFGELPDRIGATRRIPLTEDDRAVLLERLMASHGGRILGHLARPADFVDPLDSLIGELVAEGISPDQLDEVVARARTNEEWDRERNHALAAIYRAYRTAIETAAGPDPRRDGRDMYLDIAEALRADPARIIENLHGRRELRILGLTDLRGGWRGLIGALRESEVFERITIYALDDHLVRVEGLRPDEVSVDGHCEPPSPPSGHCEPRSGEAIPSPTAAARPDRVAAPPLAMTATEAPPLAMTATGAPTLATTTVLHAPDTDREVEDVAMRVRRLVEAGVPYHRIAVVSRKARPHVDLVLAALERAGVPATARRRIGYREIPVVKSLIVLLQAAADGWTRFGLAELAGQPYFANRLNTRIVNFLGYRRGITGLEEWTAAHEGLVAEAIAREAGEEPEDERRGWVPPRDAAEDARDRFAKFAAVAGGLDQERSLTEWLRWLEEFLEQDPWEMEQRIRKIPDEEWEIARVDLAGWRALHATVHGWRQALETWDGHCEPRSGEAIPRLSAEGFLARFQSVLSGDAALWTVMKRGVQVLEGLAAAYRPFEHLFVVGMEAGTFPTRRPASAILHEEDRRALRDAGLPLDLESVWEARERALFRALQAGGQHLTLSHATLDASGREQVGSVFLDEVLADNFRPFRPFRPVTEETIPTGRVLTPGMPLVPDQATLEHARAAAEMERLREASELHPWNGKIEDPALLAGIAEKFGEGYMWSPTQLESYAKCPWSWFSQRMLRLEKLEDPEQEIEAAVRGTIWHAALEGFWAKAMEKFRVDGRTGEKLMLRTTDLDWARPMLAESLDAAWEAEGEGAWLGHPAMHQVTRKALRVTLTRYLEWEVKYNEDALGNARTNAFKWLRTAVASHERSFEGMVLERNGVRFQYRGSIDRVEVGVDERVSDSDRYVAAVDYKSSKWSAPGGGEKKAWDDDVVLQVPLYAHAISMLEGKDVARTEYRAIRSCESVHTLPFVKLQKSGKSSYALVVDEDAAAKTAAALDASAAHVARVRDGEYPAGYVESCKCPPFCHAWDICRVAGGPKGMRD